MTNYTVRVGKSVRTQPVGDYNELLSQEVEERDDDDATIVHVGNHTPTCTDCNVGLLRWAEAGYVPWHRVCDRCGSHWDLHPITWGPARPTRPAQVSHIDHDPDCDVYWDDSRPCSCGMQDVIDREEKERVELLSRSGGLVRWVQGRGEVPLDPDEHVSDDPTSPTWGQFVELIEPHHWAEAEAEAVRMAGSVVVPCAWARRARFY